MWRVLRGHAARLTETTGGSGLGQWTAAAAAVIWGLLHAAFRAAPPTPPSASRLQAAPAGGGELFLCGAELVLPQWTQFSSAYGDICIFYITIFYMVTYLAIW